MAYFDFIWTSHNIEHIAEHGITADEAQDVVSFPMEEGTSRVPGRYTAIGFTATGKYPARLVHSDSRNQKRYSKNLRTVRKFLPLVV